MEQESFQSQAFFSDTGTWASWTDTNLCFPGFHKGSQNDFPRFLLPGKIGKTSLSFPKPRTMHRERSHSAGSKGPAGLFQGNILKKAFLTIFAVPWMEILRQFQPSGFGSLLNLLQGLVYAVDHADRQCLIPLYWIPPGFEMSCRIWDCRTKPGWGSQLPRWFEHA